MIKYDDNKDGTDDGNDNVEILAQFNEAQLTHHRCRRSTKSKKLDVAIIVSV